MTISPENVAQDLAPFADLGTPPPRLTTEGHANFVYFQIKGQETVLEVSSSSPQIREHIADQIVDHGSIRSLLASDRYGDLRRWAANQRASINPEGQPPELIPLTGNLDGGIERYDLAAVEQHLGETRKPNSTRVLLIDGPAGIGKTQFISNLAIDRAQNYLAKRDPLLLHIQSRGRTLSYLFDLMAFSLQRIRVEVTFDQIPILAKHGLVVIAIDGFDELADPDGYGTAWHQVSDLVASVRGGGTLILAGRETFIGRDRLLKDVTSLRPPADDVSVLTLRPPSKGEAIAWLRRQGWSDGQVESFESYLEPNSLVLRPFFLSTLADPSIAARLGQSTASDVMAILIEAMIDREADKFGEAVEGALTPRERRAYVFALMSEVARDLAENSTVAISDATLAWLVDVAMPKEIPEQIARILKARAHTVAFLTNDERSNYRKFYHDKFYEFFLSGVVIDAVSQRLAIKPLVRNLFASSFLETFGTLITENVPADIAKRFLEGALDLCSSYAGIDRTRRNVSALLLASLGAADLVPNFELDDVETDEVRFSGTAGVAALRNVVISQLDCRGGDLSKVRFEGGVVISLIGDEATRLPNTFPLPSRIRDVSLDGGQIVDPVEVRSWVEAHLSERPREVVGLVPERLQEHEAIQLLQRTLRQRQYWLRRGDDIYSNRILNAAYWPLLERILTDNDLIKSEVRDASGTDARFLHIKYREELLAEDAGNEQVRAFYRDLVSELDEDG